MGSSQLMQPSATSVSGKCHAAAFHQVLRIIVTLLLLCLGSTAQQGTQTGATPDAPSTTAQQAKPHPNNPVQSGATFVSVLSKRSIVFPDIATNTGPLSPQEKFKLSVNNSVSLSIVFASFASAGRNQLRDVPAAFGPEAKGYAKRFGTAMARNASSKFFGTFLLASALHQDPRFFVRSDLNFGESVKYSIHRVFITRRDSGEPVFNWSGLLGALAAEGLANVYFPDSYRTVGNTFSRFGNDLGWMAAFNLLRQYWPRINRKLKLVQEPLPPSTSQPLPSAKP